jgi:hypothetical protein
VALRMGYRHPGLNLLAIANADPEDLARQLSIEERDKNGILWRVGCSPLEAMQLIMKANAELLPYFEGKAAQKIEVDGKVLGVMIYEPVPTTARESGDVLDLTSFPNPE